MRYTKKKIEDLVALGIRLRFQLRRTSRGDDVEKQIWHFLSGFFWILNSFFFTPDPAGFYGLRKMN
jgi:hypothetical protein